MKWKCSKEIYTYSVLFAVSIVAGAGSGALAGWISASAYQRTVAVEPVQQISNSTSTGSGVQTSSTIPVAGDQKLTVVQVDQVPPEAIVPPAFSGQETSVAVVYQKPAKTVRVFRDEDALGQAVAVTSDGWFVVPQSLVGDHRMSEIVLWYQGKALAVSRGVLDHRSSVAFLKVDSAKTKAPSFARFQDVTKGLSVWVERRPGSFEPMSITSLFGEVEGLVGYSSDSGARRPLLSGMSYAQDSGSPVWAGNGSLIGLVLGSKEGRTRFIPSSAWAPSLFGIFSDGVIAHASLGVLAVDLSSIRLVSATENLPERGAWLVSDVSKNPVIALGSPAEKAGLKEGDVITQVDHDILDGRADLGEILIQYKPNSSVVLKVVRGSQTIDVPVTLGSSVVSEELKK
jgi:S1-C subfamily serine protease